jgi:hypothetical protein
MSTHDPNSSPINVVPFPSQRSTELSPFLVEHGGFKWAMHRGPDGQPLVYDIDLATWLGYERPRDVRKLVERYSSALGQVCEIWRKPGPEGGRPGKDYYLNEFQALLICGRSDTPKGAEILKAMVHVFMMARSGQLAPVSPNLQRLQAVNAALDEHRVELDMIGTTLQKLTDRQHEQKRQVDRELAAQREALDLLDRQMHRNMPTQEERAATAKAIKEACECRVSERERLMLAHIALEGPATSMSRIGAAAKVSASMVCRLLPSLIDRGLIDVEQRDPSMPNLKNYAVILDGLSGHTPECERLAEQVGTIGHAPEGATVLRVENAAVHVVPPNIPHIPQPQLALQEVEPSIPVGMSEREELMKTVRGICYHNGLDYHDFMSKLYIRMKFEGMDCRKTKKISRIDYMERHGWCRRAIEIAKAMPIHEIRQAQNVGHA